MPLLHPPCAQGQGSPRWPQVLLGTCTSEDSVCVSFLGKQSVFTRKHEVSSSNVPKNIFSGKKKEGFGEGWGDGRGERSHDTTQAPGGVPVLAV